MSTIFSDYQTVALAQIAPIWLDRAASLAKMIDYVREAGRSGAQLVAFGEGCCRAIRFGLNTPTAHALTLTCKSRFTRTIWRRPSMSRATILSRYVGQHVSRAFGC